METWTVFSNAFLTENFDLEAQSTLNRHSKVQNSMQDYPLVVTVFTLMSSLTLTITFVLLGIASMQSGIAPSVALSILNRTDTNIAAVI